MQKELKHCLLPIIHCEPKRPSLHFLSPSPPVYIHHNLNLHKPPVQQANKVATLIQDHDYVTDTYETNVLDRWGWKDTMMGGIGQSCTGSARYPDTKASPNPWW